MEIGREGGREEGGEYEGERGCRFHECSDSCVIAVIVKLKKLKGMTSYIGAKFRTVTKIRNVSCDHDVGM